MISYNETIYGAFENCKVISDISKISRLKFGFIWTRVGVLNSFLRLSNTPTLIPWEKALVFQVFSFLLHSSVIHIAKIKDASLVVEK